jgi:hypothetical protein
VPIYAIKIESINLNYINLNNPHLVRAGPSTNTAISSITTSNMFKFLKHRGGQARSGDDAASDINTESANINVSDSAPILSRIALDLSNNVHHDLRQANDSDGKLYLKFVAFFFFIFVANVLSLF